MYIQIPAIQDSTKIVDIYLFCAILYDLRFDVKNYRSYICKFMFL